MLYTRKQLRETAEVPDKTLRWMLDKLDIQPVDFNCTAFGSPIFMYDENVLAKLQEYLAYRRVIKEQQRKGKRCRGGCNRYLPVLALNSQQICDQCRRKAWIKNEVCHRDPLLHAPDRQIIKELQDVLEKLSA